MKGRLVAGVVAAFIVFCAPAGVQAASQSIGVHFRANCGPPKVGVGRCMSVTVTDAHGRPIHQAPSRSAVAPRSGRIGAVLAPGDYSPPEIQTAYGITRKNAPIPQTIAVVDAFNEGSKVKSDLDHWNAYFGYPAFPVCQTSTQTACWQRVDQNGNPATFANSCTAGNDCSDGWVEETNMDVEWAHSMCQNCKLLLVESFNESNANEATAERTALAMGANVVSNSFGGPESRICTPTCSAFYPGAFSKHGVAILAASGDYGYPAGPSYPADLNTVIAVGGTSLYLNTNWTWNSEFVWGGYNGANGWQGSGSGCSTINGSAYTTAPSWQTGINDWSQTGCGSHRDIADIAAVADPATSAAIWSPTTTAGTPSWQELGGTSLATPIAAGLYAIAGNVASYNWPAARAYANPGSFHDIHSGSNDPSGTCAHPIECQGWFGYDGPTGMGTPRGLNGF